MKTREQLFGYFKQAKWTGEQEFIGKAQIREYRFGKYLFSRSCDGWGEVIILEKCPDKHILLDKEAWIVEELKTPYILERS